MLIPMHPVLGEAQKMKYGMAAPNVFNVESIRLCFEAAIELRAPMIIAVGRNYDFELMGDATRFYAKRHPEVPVSLHLDHGTTFEAAVGAIRAGFTSVMVDRSQAPLLENIRESTEIVKMAHAVGVSVEGEVGHVGQGTNYQTQRQDQLTTPEDAFQYATRTGVDCVAIAIGTAHGFYAELPRLDFGRLIAIRKVVDIPLVLHGGSSTGDNNLSKAVRSGITKVNLATDLMVAGAEKAREFLNNEPRPKAKGVVEAAGEGYKSELIRYMKLLGQANRW